VPISSSPHRYTFQRDCYVEDKMKAGVDPDTGQLDYYQEIINRASTKFDSQESMENNLEYDLRTTDWILEKVRVSDSYAQSLYAALCNNDFIRSEIMPILKEQKWYCSWRSAGGIIADMRQEGDYIDWYCSGSWNEDAVSEGIVTPEIKEDLKKMGWMVISYSMDKD